VQLTHANLNMYIKNAAFQIHLLVCASIRVSPCLSRCMYSTCLPVSLPVCVLGFLPAFFSLPPILWIFVSLPAYFLGDLALCPCVSPPECVRALTFACPSTCCLSLCLFVFVPLFASISSPVSRPVCIPACPSPCTSRSCLSA
jgi:hypothetical protein